MATSWFSNTTDFIFEAPSFQVCLSREEPWEGLRFSGQGEWSHLPWPESLLAVTAEIAAENDLASGPPDDAFIRENSVHAVLETTPSRPFRLELCWTVIGDRFLASDYVAFDLLVSVQTPSLDGHVPLNVVSTVPANWTSTEGTASFSLDWKNVAQSPTFRFRPPENSIEWIDVCHPMTAAHRFAVQSREDQSFQLRHRLFDCPLEKGVILRGLIRNAARVGSWEDAPGGEQLTNFFRQPLPLSA